MPILPLAHSFLVLFSLVTVLILHIPCQPSDTHTTRLVPPPYTLIELTFQPDWNCRAGGSTDSMALWENDGGNINRTGNSNLQQIRAWRCLPSAGASDEIVVRSGDRWGGEYSRNRRRSLVYRWCAVAGSVAPRAKGNRRKQQQNPYNITRSRGGGRVPP